MTPHKTELGRSHGHAADETEKINIDMDEMKRFLEEFKNRRVYSELSVEILQTIPDDKLEQAIIDYISTKIENYQTELSDVSNLPPGFQMVYSTWVLEGEVNNGGFNQFFFNPSGQFAEMALRSLELIGATDYSELVRRAIDTHQLEMQNPALQDLYEQATRKAFSESYKLSGLGDCDDAFYELNDRLSELRVSYVRSHPEDFVGK